jgi:hypothetical protein
MSATKSGGGDEIPTRLFAAVAASAILTCVTGCGGDEVAVAGHDLGIVVGHSGDDVHFDPAAVASG